MSEDTIIAQIIVYELHIRLGKIIKFWLSLALAVTHIDNVLPLRVIGCAMLFFGSTAAPPPGAAGAVGASCPGAAVVPHNAAYAVMEPLEAHNGPPALVHR